MNEIILSQTGSEITADSRDIAENFDKQHKDVLEAVRNLTAENSATKSMFIESSYESRGKEYPCYLMNRDGFSVLAMGFTGSYALEWKLKYIAAFNKMENSLRNRFAIPQTYQEALRLAADQAEMISKQKEYIKSTQPAVLFAKSVQTAQTSILIGDLAKIIKQNGIDIGQNRLFIKLREEGYLIRRRGANYNMPTQKSMDLRLFEIKETAITHSDGHVTVSKTVKATGRGQIYFVNRFLGVDR